MYGFNPLVGDGAPIIGAVLSNDSYKFTTGQFALLCHPRTPVVSAFHNRTASERLAEIIDERDLRRELDHVRSLRMRPDEIDYLYGLRLVNHVPRYAPKETNHPRVFHDEYVDFMREFQYPSYQLSVTADGQYDLRFPGLWEKQTYWECPGMRIMNTLRIRALLAQMTPEQQTKIYRDAQERLEEKILFFKAHPWIQFIDFGFRRAGGPEWHDELDERLFRALPPKQLLGVSEMSAARRHGTPSLGTIPHEPIQVLSGIYYEDDDRAGTMESHQRFFLEWDEFYDGEFSVALTDTYGRKYFFDNFPHGLAVRWSGLRQDSGNPVSFLDDAEDFYRRHKVEMRTKRAVPSDGLTTRLIHSIDAANRERFNVAHGLGTSLTFDFSDEFGVSPIPSISIVVKAVEACGHELVKVPDNSAKALGSPEALARVRRLTGDVADKTFVTPAS
ncbi:MAG: hypothetical protein A2942_00520 [Candidatus Lloydbacteria bacterium RIFCSPLOWO2_01_FULL_50_20]|uniref:nicotinate phosphoribosyltransferase n=1 Tax=Candidatus Lloydbacteria bacterium RIFCSPLOWO2_01_FULL_50_20 TaxID=1798665 RepID=A0A1G2DCM9_9BACT|nr:MAG: hypothetical protein A3C13_02120 [Candidatus Lloydbacteria bacterium RIFCSPHIGHO2_02_FULL_50_11]OGZ11263.1 MAG: hypothetical protein A2942_00520 [Candidatus Lloydbacteria bacterium RIFCSPLOWO2_01_FULL_50_20]